MTTDGVWRAGQRPTGPVRRVFALTFVNVFGTGLVMAYQLIFLTDVLHIELGRAGFIIGLMGIMALVAAPLSGTLTDRVGSIAVLMLGLGLAAAGYALLTIARTASAATTAAVVIGLGTGASWPVSSTIIALLTTPTTRSRAFAMHRMSINASVGLGGLVGGFVANERRPATFKALFVGNIATFVIAIAIALSMRRAVDACELSVAASASQTRNTTGSYREVLRDRVFAHSLLYDLATGMTFGFAFDLLPKALQLVGIENRWIGLIFAVNTGAIVALQLPVVGLVVGHRRVRLLQLQLALFTVAYGACWFATSLRHNAIITIAFLAGVSFAIGECMMGAVRSAMVVDMAPEPLVGRYNALTSTLFQAGMSIARPIGAIALKHGAGTLWVLASAIALIGIVHLQRFEHQLPQTQRRMPTTQSTPT